jgi:hypothetical protein
LQVISEQQRNSLLPVSTAPDAAIVSRSRARQIYFDTWDVDWWRWRRWRGREVLLRDLHLPGLRRSISDGIVVVIVIVVWMEKHALMIVRDVRIHCYKVLKGIIAVSLLGEF